MFFIVLSILCGGAEMHPGRRILLDPAVVEEDEKPRASFTWPGLRWIEALARNGFAEVTQVELELTEFHGVRLIAHDMPSGGVVSGIDTEERA
jgi:hypothetical protein